MLFPGAVYFVGIFFALAAACFSLAVGFLGGAIVYKIAGYLIEKTKTRKSLKLGRAIPWPWWCHADRWFKFGWVVCGFITLYCTIGPWLALIRWMEGGA